MESRALWSRLESWGVAAAALLAPISYWVASTSPLYTDEIGWKLIQSHFVDDGFRSRAATLAPGCGPDLVSTSPVLIPIRYVDSFMGGLLLSPSDIRYYGLFLFLVWFVVIWLLLRRVLASVAGGWAVLGAILGVSTLGVMPLLLVLSRPEQVLLIGITAFLALAVDERSRPPSSLWRDLTLALAMVLGSAFVLAAHPRAFLVLPIAALACFRVIQRRVVATIVASTIAVFAAFAFTDFNMRLACPGDPAVRHLFSVESVTLAASNHMLPVYFSHLIQMMRDHLGSFLFLVQFDFLSNYTSNMFPAYPYPLLGASISLFLSEFVALLALAGIASFVLAAIEGARRREGLIALGAVASSWMIILVSIVARATRNNYEAELMEPLLILTSVLSIWIAREDLIGVLGETQLAFYARAFFAALLVLSVTSQIAFLAGYAPFVEGNWGRPGYIPDQLHSASVSGYSSIRSAISTAAARCNIKPSNNLKYLVLDEVTYFEFRHSKAPQLMTNINPQEWGKGISDLRGLLASKGSDGAVVACHWLPRALQSVAIRTGEFCCVPKSKI